MSDQEQTQTCSAEVKPLGELLQYEDGSIVSRVLLKNKGGTVTLFAFDRGEGLSEHIAPFEAFVFVVDGEAEVELGGKVYSVRAGGDDYAACKHSTRIEGGNPIQDAADHDTSIKQSNECCVCLNN
jgi:hypothetical protein